jgi:transposase
VLRSLNVVKQKDEAEKGREKGMPKLLRARVAHDEKEEEQLRKIATSRHGPADWIMQARMVVYSWDGMRVDAIARALQCCEKTVRLHLKRFNEQGLDGLGDRPRLGRRARLTEAERSQIIAFSREPAPGSLQRKADGTLEARDEQESAQWSLDALTQSAHEAGIQVERSQIRRIFLSEGVRWRRTHSWGTSNAPDFVSKERRSSRSMSSHP